MAPSDTLKEVQTHLSEVLQEPAKPLQPKLLDKLGTLEIERLSEAEKAALINQLAELLPRLQQDATPIIPLIEDLIRPRTFTFSQVLAIKPSINFIRGLESEEKSINLIMLSLLEKATVSKTGSDILAGQIGVILFLVRRWLGTKHPEVAQKALRILIALLTTANTSNTSSSSLIDEHLMWRRIFRDRDIYASIFSLCSFQTLGQNDQLDKAGKTHAQARLLDLLSRIDSEPVRSSQFPEIERIYGVTDGGLLQFATVHMVDYREDILMHIILIDFFVELLWSPSALSDSYKALDFLIKTGVHSRTVSFYVNPETIDRPEGFFLHGPAAKYVKAYICCCPSHLLGESSPLELILGRLERIIGDIRAPPTKSQLKAHAYDFKVLNALPQAALRTRPDLELLAASLDSIDEIGLGLLPRPEPQSEVMTMER